MNRKVMWLTGKTCVGKSTYADDLVCRTSWQVIHTGAACRGRFGELAMAGASNPVTPEISEEYVRRLVQASILEIPDGETLIIDSMPRSRSQIAFIRYLMEEVPDIEHEIWYCTCGEDERQKRIRMRGNTSGDRALIKARLAAEDPVFLDVLEGLVVGRMPLRAIDLGTRTELPVGGPVDTDLRVMFAKHIEFVDTANHMRGEELSAMGYRMSTLDEADPMCTEVVWMRRFLEATKKEIDEALAEIPEKWWTVDKADLRALRVECIDAWHFMMSFAIASGMSAHDFASLYYQKRAINLARARSGTYSSRSKTGRDDEDLGKAKGETDATTE